MHTQFTQFISHHELLSKGAKVIVGVSGGADSVALLHLLHMTRHECIVAHCNFHLRDVESDRDQAFVIELAQRWNMKLEVISFDTTAFAEKNRLSIEMAARQLRYEWFEQIRQKHDAEAIAVGHHRDDNVETVLLNLIRGTGIRGLSGILPKNGKIIRPMLAMKREEIDRYLVDHQLDHITDSSNLECFYLRNRIRLELIPLMEQFNPSVREAIERTSENLHQVEEIYFGEIERMRSQLVSLKGEILSIDIKQLKKYPQANTLLFELLHPYGFNRATCDALFDALEGISGKKFYAEQYMAIKERNEIILSPLKESKEMEYQISDEYSFIHFPIHLRISHQPSAGFELSKEKNCAQLDADKINFPLTLRKWRQGDTFHPLGLKGKKKISDLFTDLKYSQIQKEEAWLLCSNDQILWIVGERIDHRFRVTDATKKVIIFTIHE